MHKFLVSRLTGSTLLASKLIATSGDEKVISVWKSDGASPSNQVNRTV
jgi:hypothetical protein